MENKVTRHKKKYAQQNLDNKGIKKPSFETPCVQEAQQMSVSQFIF